MDNLHPVQDRLLQRTDKEALLGQRGACLWLTGLSGSGKTTIAIALEQALHRLGRFCVVLDGDDVRMGLNADLGFSEDARMENIRRVAEVAKLFVRQGAIVVCCFVSPTDAIRERARTIIGDADFIEVFVDTPLEECERRDVKGLYAKARSGAVKDFTGVSAPFEAPTRPFLHLRTAGRSVTDCTTELMNTILPRIQRS